MKVFIWIALIFVLPWNVIGYQWTQRYNHWHAGTWQIFPQQCDPYCFPHVDRFAVKIWKALGQACPQTIDDQDVKDSVHELDYKTACSVVSLSFHTGAKSSIYPKIHILKMSFFTKFTFSNSHFYQNSHFQILIFDKIHIFKISFFT